MIYLFLYGAVVPVASLLYEFFAGKATVKWPTGRLVRIMKLKRSEICIIALTLLLLAAAVGIQTGKGNSEADFSIENLNAVQAYSDDADIQRGCD